MFLSRFHFHFPDILDSVWTPNSLASYGAFSGARLVVCSSFPLHIIGSPTVQKSILLAAIQKEIQRHDFSHFVDEPPSVRMKMICVEGEAIGGSHSFRTKRSLPACRCEGRGSQKNRMMVHAESIRSLLFSGLEIKDRCVQRLGGPDGIEIFP
jgi:hypothetical protein